MNASITHNATHHTEPNIPSRLLWRIGREMYLDGRPLSDCLTASEREGWLQMLAIEADTETEIYLDKQVKNETL